jgi:ABC-type phosphate/phosphonate transport system substrate-binding protein
MLNGFRRTIMAAAGLFGILGVLGAISPERAAAEIRLGTVPRLSAEQLQTMYKPLTDYLTAEIGEKVTLFVPKDFASVKTDAKAGKMDIGFVNPLLYVQIKDLLNVEPLALSSEVKSGTRFRGIIIVRKDSGINKVQGPGPEGEEAHLRRPGFGGGICLSDAADEQGGARRQQGHHRASLRKEA